MAPGSTRVFALAVVVAVGLSAGPGSATDAWLSFERNPIDVTVERIDDAEETVDAAVYKFDEGSIRKALRRAIARGVRVRMVVDYDEARARGSRVRDVIRAGAEVRVWRKGKLHAKFVVIDRAEVLMGSFNWTESAQKQNVELLVELDQPDEVKRLEALFEVLWQKADRLGD